MSYLDLDPARYTAGQPARVSTDTLTAMDQGDREPSDARWPGEAMYVRKNRIPKRPWGPAHYERLDRARRDFAKLVTIFGGLGALGTAAERALALRTPLVILSAIGMVLGIAAMLAEDPLAQRRLNVAGGISLLICFLAVYILRGAGG